VAQIDFKGYISMDFSLGGRSGIHATSMNAPDRMCRLWATTSYISISLPPQSKISSHRFYLIREVFNAQQPSFTSFFSQHHS
jgi:hypothetical protein